MSIIIFKTEHSVSKSWAEVTESLNSEYIGPYEDWNNSVYWRGGVTDHDQKINSFAPIGHKIGLYKSPDKSLAIAMAAPTAGQTLGVKHLDLELIKSKLNSGIKTVYFGYIFDGQGGSQSDIIEKSIYYGRNAITNRLENFISGEEITGHITSAIWMAFYKIKNCDIYLSIINDNLIDSTIIRTTNEKPDFSNDSDKYDIINTHDGNFKETLLLPSIKQGKFFGTGVIGAFSSKFTIDVLGHSRLHILNKDVIKQENLPDIELLVNSNLTYKVNKSRIDIDMGDKTTGFISYHWLTGTELDYSKEALIQEFAIIKI